MSVDALLEQVKSLSESEKSDLICELASELSALSMSRLVKQVEERFQVVAPVQQVIDPSLLTPRVAPIPALTTYDVILEAAGPSKIQVIRAVRAEMGLGLRESKALVDAAPSTLKESLDREDAEKLVQIFEELGARASLKPRD